MNFFALSLPMGRYAGISVRLHFTFFIFAFYRIQQFDNLVFGLLFMIGLYISILLHEFGHALAARFCDGEANDIILWPLGGLAFCRPLFNPTAHLITAAAGPFVSLALFVIFYLLDRTQYFFGLGWLDADAFVHWMMLANGMLLVFNLIPAFPMDGGRILRDILWYWLGVDRATTAAVILSKLIAGTTILLAFFTQHYWLAFLALFIFLESSMEKAALGMQGLAQPFSLKERFKRGKRQETFQDSRVQKQEELGEGFHRCAVCGRSEQDARDLVFRVSSNGQEYCSEHLPSRYDQKA